MYESPYQTLIKVASLSVKENEIVDFEEEDEMLLVLKSGRKHKLSNHYKTGFIVLSPYSLALHLIVLIDI